MKFSLENPHNGHVIRGYEAGGILVDNERVTTSLLLMDTHLDTAWGPTSSELLNKAHVTAIADLRPEVVIIGTGEKQVFPPVSVLAQLINDRIGVEIMDTAAACRTYTVLSAEGRRVLCALFP